MKLLLTLLLLIQLLENKKSSASSPILSTLCFRWIVVWIGRLLYRELFVLTIGIKMHNFQHQRNVTTHILRDFKNNISTERQLLVLDRRQCNHMADEKLLRAGLVPHQLPTPKRQVYILAVFNNLPEFGFPLSRP